MCFVSLIGKAATSAHGLNSASASSLNPVSIEIVEEDENQPSRRSKRMKSM
jgi:hypothetical protein